MLGTIISGWFIGQQRRYHCPMDRSIFWSNGTNINCVEILWR